MIKSVAAAAQDEELGEVLRMHLEMEGEEEEEEEPRGARREETNTEEETCCCWVVVRLKDSAPNPLLVMLSLLLQQEKPCPNIARTDSHPQRKKTEKRKKNLSKTGNYDSS
jgi:hypothetical protein